MINHSPEFLGEAAIKKGAPAPFTFAKTTEHSHQVALMIWSTLPDVKATFPELKWLYSNANGGSRGDSVGTRMAEGGKMKAEGVKVGVSDLTLPVKRGEYSGLYIEMKRLPGKGVGPSPEQTEFIEFVRGQGFAACVCYGWRDARDVIIAYLTQRW